MKALLIGLCRLYTTLISPLLGPGKCRFYPSCSAYSCEALARHGCLKGGWLSLRRIASCHPYGRRPFLDPVPSSIKTPSTRQTRTIA